MEFLSLDKVMHGRLPGSQLAVLNLRILQLLLQLMQLLQVALLSLLLPFSISVTNLEKVKAGTQSFRLLQARRAFGAC